MKAKVKEIRISAMNLIRKGDRYLFVQEKKPEVYGQWNLVAGKVDSDDFVLEAAIRESKEETGFRVRPLHILGIYNSRTPKRNTVYFVFESKILSGKFSWPEDEILQAKWFTVKELRRLKNLRHKFFFDVIKRAKEGIHLPLNVIIKVMEGH